MWPQLAVLFVSLLVGYALYKPPKPPKPAKLEDLKLPQVREGSEIGLVGGTVWIEDPQIAWYGDLKTSAIKSSGGKK